MSECNCLPYQAGGPCGSCQDHARICELEVRLAVLGKDSCDMSEALAKANEKIKKLEAKLNEKEGS